jgi:hypothetical protein
MGSPMPLLLTADSRGTVRSLRKHLVDDPAKRLHRLRAPHWYAFHDVARLRPTDHEPGVPRTPAAAPSASPRSTRVA